MKNIKNLVVVLSTKILILVMCFSIAVPAQAATREDVLQALGQLRVSLFKYQAAQLPGAVLGASTIVVNNDAELATALTNATGGETIQLAPGNYGKIAIVTGQYNKLTVGGSSYTGGTPSLSSTVVIESQNASNPAQIAQIDIRNSNNWHFNNIVMRPGNSGRNFKAVSMSGDNLAFENSTVDYGDYTNWTASDWIANAGFGVEMTGDNGLIKNNSIRSVSMGITVGKGGYGTKIQNNTVDGISGDGARALQDGAVWENNLFKNFKKVDANHDDCMQSWGMINNRPDQNGVVDGVTVRNNICIDTTGSRSDVLYSSPQGYAAFDGYMKNFLVENNVYISSAYHGIAYTGATNVMVRNNTIIDSNPNVSGVDTVWIRFSATKAGGATTGSTAKDNITNKVITTANNTYTNNQIVNYANYDNIFRDWSNGDVRLKSTAGFSGVGADLDPVKVGSNKTITNSSPTPTPGQNPTPTPSPTPTPGQNPTPTLENPVAADEPSVRLSVSSSNVKVGDSIKITWRSTDATECFANGDWSGARTPESGTETILVSSTGSKSFTLLCTGAGGNKSVTKTISVSDAVVNPSSPTTDDAASKMVYTTDKIVVRANANGVRLGSQIKGAEGVQLSNSTIIAGGYTWVKVDFTTGTDGYVASEYLTTVKSDNVVTTPTSDSLQALRETLIAQIMVLLKLIAELQLAR